ncbi:protein kinase domain-containing protein [Anabaena sp. WFMT]|uniref:WD40 domain-containing protein n=1 Tax=Anabaena sp. WFMT TaxID=3449730 RepID=UPI003F1FFD77
MTVLTCASTGKSITLLGESIDSGEAKVWRTNLNGYLAKIYHLPTPERLQKLAVMISYPPTDPNSHLNHISFAWPKSLLKDANGNYVGFLMPEVRNARQLIDIYNPQRCQKLKLAINWRFLHVTALNIASFIAAIHDSGYVLGDIKPQNILVNNRALPSIIDTDSFQVKNPKNGKVYRCLVGSDGYTPPELIDADIASIEQTEIHDRFRLAVIIYQLLFSGNSPFQGKWIGAGETPEVNELIRQGLWLYSPNSLIQSVERTIPLDIVHPEVKKYFLKCFNDGYENPNLRPTAKEWMTALKVASNELNVCKVVDSHYYSQTYGKCYWCDRSTKLGIDIFGVNKPKELPAIHATTVAGILTITGHSNSINSIVYSPDGNTLASAGRDQVIKLWNTSTGGLIKILTGHSDWINSLAYSPDGKILISGSRDKTIKVWNVSTGREIRILAGHNNSVCFLSYSPDGNTLASGSADKTIKLWNVSTGKVIITLKEHSDSVLSLAYSPEGNTLASGGADNTIKLWNISTGKVILTLIGHDNWVRSLAYSPDGKILASGSSDNTIKLWNISTGKVIFTLTGHSDSVPSLTYSPDGKILASASGDKTIKLWNASTGWEINTLKGHSNSVRSLAYSADGKILASGSADNSIKIWPILSQTIYSRTSTPASKPVHSRTSTPQLKLVRSRTSTSKSKAFFKPSILVRNKQRNQGFWGVILLFCLLGFSYFLTVANNKNNQTPNFPIEEIPGGSIL